ncbi:MAG: hypothetical protein QOE61_3361 [Micromonosporaceae bacterium]|jgi:uncharacterized protein YbjT (DUF2867 family)|nr:hypothetical protein [Micromonosporaceae bacterium]
MNNIDSSGTVAVVGATGQQGAATVDALLRRGMHVRALTRNTGSDAARALTDRGVTVVEADLEAPESIRNALSGAAMAFAMTTYDGPKGTEGEVANGKVIVDAAGDVELPFLVYSSVGGAERNTGIPHFESKRRIEEFLTGTVPANFVRPTFFMENLLQLIARDGDQLIVRMPMPDGIPLQLISVRDIGNVASALLANADPSAPPIEIAGDELTGSQIADAVGQRLGTSATFVEVPLDVLGDDQDRKKMFKWFTTLPSYRADLGRTRELAPDVENLSTWLARQALDHAR